MKELYEFLELVNYFVDHVQNCSLIANLSSDNEWVHGKNCLTNELDATCDSVVWGSSMEQLVNCQKVNSKMIIAIILKKDEQGYKLKEYFNIFIISRLHL